MLTLAAGQVVEGRYTLRSLLGGGRLGQVWRARDEERDADVALKVLLPEFADHPGALALLRDEYRKQAALRHPNVLRVEAIAADARPPFLVLELAPGGDLDARAGAPPEDLLPRLVEVARALDYAHRRGVVHRDVRPSNVLIGTDGTARLADFGIAAALAGVDAGLPIDTGGSRAYMSPAQAAGEPPSPADDLYAFGALAYELATGRPPLGPEPEPGEIASREPAPLAAEPEHPWPGEVRRLIDRLLAKSPDDRPASAAAVAEALAAAAASLGVAAPVPGAVAEAQAVAPIRPTRFRARNEGGDARASAGPRSGEPAARRTAGPAVWAGAALVLLLAVAAAVIFWLPAAVSPEAPAPAAAPSSDPADPGEAAPVLQPPPEAETPADPAELARQREAAERALGRLLALQGELEPTRPERWGPALWREATELTEAGDDALLGRRYPEAERAYQDAIERLTTLRERLPAVLEEALAAAEAALEAGDWREAVAGFERALTLEPENTRATRGLERAQNLERVLELMARGRSAEDEGDLAAAREAYAEAAGLDPDWRPAAESLARVARALADAAFRRVLSSGYAALADERYDDAIAAFEEALSRRPDSTDAEEGLTQAREAKRLGAIALARARAVAFETRERWSDAVEQYRAALAVDPSLVFATEGLARAEARASLDAKLERLIEEPDRLFVAETLADANRLLGEAQAVPEPGPRLEQQIERLSVAIVRASQPVPVELVSDGATEVAVYRVGRLGTFERRQLDLRPGDYVAVGSRDGFRDVRVPFAVRPGDSPPAVTVVCRERI